MVRARLVRDPGGLLPVTERPARSVWHVVRDLHAAAAAGEDAPAGVNVFAADDVLNRIFQTDERVLASDNAPAPAAPIGLPRKESADLLRGVARRRFARQPRKVTTETKAARWGKAA